MKQKKQLLLDQFPFFTIRCERKNRHLDVNGRTILLRQARCAKAYIVVLTRMSLTGMPHGEALT